MSGLRTQIKMSTFRFNSIKGCHQDSNRKPVAAYHCRFCQVDGHSSLYCLRYLTVEQRIDRCVILGNCTHCTSFKHRSEECPGVSNNLFRACRFCKCSEHVGALCPKRTKFVPKAKVTDSHMCLSTGEQESRFLLPVLNVGVTVHGGPMVRFKFFFLILRRAGHICQMIF